LPGNDEHGKVNLMQIGSCIVPAGALEHLQAHAEINARQPAEILGEIREIDETRVDLSHLDR